MRHRVMQCNDKHVDGWFYKSWRFIFLYNAIIIPQYYRVLQPPSAQLTLESTEYNENMYEEERQRGRWAYTDIFIPTSTLRRKGMSLGILCLCNNSCHESPIKT